MLLDQSHAMKLLKKYGLKHPKTLVVKDEKGLAGFKLNFPVVLKVDSGNVIHKSDLGLVFVGLNSVSEVKDKMKEAVKVLKANKVGKYKFVIQETVSGVELIVGVKKDSVFGNVIIFGLGGVLVELLKDVSMRIAPLKKSDCLEMLDEIKGKQLLDGYRGLPVVNKEELIKVLMNTSKMVESEKCISEVDFNPVIANEKEVIVVDARIIKNA